ncbi:helix-turn-helix domain-containing protein [Variovorax sp. WS11]|uniref:helix-turn-helix domain-containing protein n=1 Tax=Variovorax sp. WS11 TaxID=1105204 RepID=UPI001EF244B3|nr:helix-turn-helix transcriptional regulator [Variovorax sp. WS11]
MDKRRKRSNADGERRLRAEFYAAIASGSMSVGQAVAAMRRISKLTQPEFAEHRGLSVQSLRLIEADKANPTIETLEKIAGIFGLQVGFVPKNSQRVSARDLERASSEIAGSDSDR